MTALVKNSRRFLKRAEDDLLGSGQQIIKGVENKNESTEVETLLCKVFQLYEGEAELHKALEGGQFSEAVSCYERCEEHLKQVGEIKELTCFEHLTPRVRRSVSKLKANVDLATQQVCKSYEETKYTQVLEVFEKKLLGFDNFPEKVRKAFEWAVDHDSKKGVQQFAYLTTTDDKLHEKMVGMDYKELSDSNPDPDPNPNPDLQELCKHLNDKQYMPCVRSVYERLWEIMCSHHKMLKYHEAFEQREIAAGTSRSA